MDFFSMLLFDVEAVLWPGMFTIIGTNVFFIYASLSSICSTYILYMLFFSSMNIRGLDFISSCSFNIIRDILILI